MGDEDAMWAHSMEFIRNSTHASFHMESDNETSEAADRGDELNGANEMLEWIGNRREQDRVRREKAASRPAMNAEERTVCLACDFVCARRRALIPVVAGATLQCFISSVIVGIVSVAVLTPIMI